MHNNLSVLQSSRNKTDLDTNRITINIYNRHTDEYIQNTSQDIYNYKTEMRQWIDFAIDYLHKNNVKHTIFEVGSATLRDAKYMRKKNVDVTCSDAAIGFVTKLREQGEEAMLFNLLNNSTPKRYGMIFANGVFPHFSEHEIHQALNNVYHSLNHSGILAFSVKDGIGEDWINEKFKELRYTKYWNLEEIKKILTEEGFELIFHNANEGFYPSHKWVNLIAKRV